LAIRIWKRPRDEQRADLNAMLGWTAVTTAVALPFGLLVWFVVSADLHPLFFVFALLAAALRSCTEIFQAMLQREGHTARVGIMIVTRALLFGCVCAGIVVYVDASSFAYLCGVLAAEGLAAAWALVRLHQIYGLRPMEPGSLLRMKELVRIGFPTIPAMAATVVLAAGDRFVITAVLGLAATGIYALGQRLAEAMTQMLFVPFSRAFGAFAWGVASRNEGDALVLVGRTALAFGYIGGVVLGLPAVFAREAIVAFAGHGYAPAVTVFVLVMPGVLAFQMSQVVSVCFSHSERLHRYAWIIIVAAAANVALTFAAVNAIGIYGAAITSVALCDAVLIAATLTIRRSGLALVAVWRLHAPLALFACYLAVIFTADMQALQTATALTVKSSIWAAYVALSVAVSAVMRDTLSGIMGKLRAFLAA
jgi:O-antigen/teichoic acid export membrane protein